MNNSSFDCFQAFKKSWLIVSPWLNEWKDALIKTADQKVFYIMTKEYTNQIQMISSQLCNGKRDQPERFLFIAQLIHNMVY